MSWLVRFLFNHEKRYSRVERGWWLYPKVLDFLSFICVCERDILGLLLTPAPSGSKRLSLGVPFFRSITVKP